MQKVLWNWDVGEVVSVEPIRSYWGKTFLVCTEDRSAYVLKEQSNPAKVMRGAELLSCLHKRGLPVAVPLTTVGQQHYCRQQGRTFVLCTLGYPAKRSQTTTPAAARGGRELSAEE